MHKTDVANHYQVKPGIVLQKDPMKLKAYLKQREKHQVKDAALQELQNRVQEIENILREITKHGKTNNS